MSFFETEGKLPVKDDRHPHFSPRAAEDMTKARKSHKCELCFQQIEPGERYFSTTATPWSHWDNECFHTFRYCRFCWDQALYFIWMHGGWDLVDNCYTEDAFREDMSERWGPILDDLGLSLDERKTCLIRMVPSAEYWKMT